MCIYYITHEVKERVLAVGKLTRCTVYYTWRRRITDRNVNLSFYAHTHTQAYTVGIYIGILYNNVRSATALEG